MNEPANISVIDYFRDFLSLFPESDAVPLLLARFTAFAVAAVSGLSYRDDFPFSLPKILSTCFLVRICDFPTYFLFLLIYCIN